MDLNPVGGTHALYTLIMQTEDGNWVVSNPIPIGSSFSLQYETSIHGVPAENFLLLPQSVKSTIRGFLNRLNGEGHHPSRMKWGLAKCWGPYNGRYMIVLECLVTSRALARIENHSLFLPTPTKLITFTLSKEGTMIHPSEMFISKDFKVVGEQTTLSKLSAAQGCISKALRETNGNEMDWTKQPWGLVSVARRQMEFALVVEWQHVGFEAGYGEGQVASGSNDGVVPPPYFPHMHLEEASH